jgi:hypothetical protein
MLLLTVMKRNENIDRISFTLPPKYRDFLVKKAQETDLSVSQYIRWLIRQQYTAAQSSDSKQS